MAKKICSALRNRRKEMGLSTEEISKRLGVIEMTYKKWEAGKTVPKRRYFERVKSVMGLDLTEFMPPALYMAVTMDEFALPIAVADSPEELAGMMGVKEQSVRACICNSKKHKTSMYLKVVL